MKKVWKLLLMAQLLVCSSGFAQPVYDWGKRIISGGGGGAICTAIAAEHAPPAPNTPTTITSTYVTGKFNGSITIPELGNMVINSQGGYDIFIFKVDANGLITFATSIGSTALDDEANDIGVIRNSNGAVTAVYVTGKSNGKFLLAKYNANLTAPLNNTVFTNANITGYAVGKGIVVNGNRVYVAGTITDAYTVDFYDYLNNTITITTNLAPGATKQLFVCAFNLNLMPLQSATPFAPGGDNEAYDIIYGGGRLFITGYYKTNIQFNSNAASFLNCSGARDIFLASLNSTVLGFDKTDQKRAGGGQLNDLNGISIQDIGHSLSFFNNAIFLAGGVSPNSTFVVDNSPSYSGSGFMAKFPYSSSTIGNVSFVCKMALNGYSKPTRPFGLTTDPNGNIIVTGVSDAGGKAYNSNGVTNMVIPGNTNPDPCGFICKYNSSGNLLWAERINQQVYASGNTSTLCGQAVLASDCDIYHTGELSTSTSTTFGTNPPFNIPGAFTTCNAFVAKASNTMTMSGNTTICYNPTMPNSVVMNAGGASNYSWSVTPSAGVTITTPTSQSPTITFPSTGTYTVSCTSNIVYGSSTACSQTGSCIVTVINCPVQDNSRMVTNLTKEGITIWPNPASDQITVSWENEENFDIELYDMMGKRVGAYNAAGSSAIINLNNSELISGLYIVKLTNKNGISKTEKLLIDRH